MKNSDKAKELLINGDFTVVMVCGDDVVTSRTRGVKPLIDFIDSGRDYSEYFSADRVVGKAAAYLYVKLKIGGVYAEVLSEKAEKVFMDYGINYNYGRLVPYIINRQGDGPCPMEQACENAKSPDEAEILIKEKLFELKSKT